MKYLETFRVKVFATKIKRASMKQRFDRMFSATLETLLDKREKISHTVDLLDSK